MKQINLYGVKISFLHVIMATIFFTGCANKNNPVGTENKVETSHEAVASAQVSGVPCDIKIAGIHFTKSVNGAAEQITVDAGNKVEFRAGEKTDYFSDPDNKLSQRTAPILLAKIDNSKPFTFVAKVTPGFTETGMYNAGVLYIYSNDLFYQKFCYEQDERGKHRMVTVRTVGTSDDNNHEVIDQPYVYMKISSDGQTIGSYYSQDNVTWQLARLYLNDYPSDLWIGLSTQCPIDKGTFSYFEDLSLELKSVSDFRMGK